LIKKFPELKIPIDKGILKIVDWSDKEKAIYTRILNHPFYEMKTPEDQILF
jgi:hypothetical protein